MTDEEITNLLRESGVVEAVLPFSEGSMRILRRVIQAAIKSERYACIEDVRTCGGNQAVEIEELILSRENA